eukprot:COSAG04_NODE_13402_length_607_cov_1.606299_1_plen_119_part_01
MGVEVGTGDGAGDPTAEAGGDGAEAGDAGAAGGAAPPHGDESEKRAHRLAVNSLMLASATRHFAIYIRQQSEQEIWLSAYDGDFGGQARAQGLLESLAGVLTFGFNPVLGGLSDAFGRK